MKESLDGPQKETKKVSSVESREKSDSILRGIPARIQKEIRRKILDEMPEGIHEESVKESQK